MVPKRKIIYSVLAIAVMAALPFCIHYLGQRQAGKGLMGTCAAPSVTEPAETRPKFKVDEIKDFTFSDDSSLKEWEEKVFKGKVVYRVDRDGGQSFVRAKSDAAASALYYKVKLDVKKRPIISWKWHIEEFPAKKGPESLGSSNEDDFAGRVYVIFPAMFITNYKVLEYIWAETLPVGTKGSSPISGNIQLIVLKSGKAPEGKFEFEERDVICDYINAFGKPPERDIGAVAFMTNAEHTKSSAQAMYDDIKIGYNKE